MCPGRGKSILAINWVEYPPASAQGEGNYDRLRPRILGFYRRIAARTPRSEEDPLFPTMYSLEVIMHGMWNTTRLTHLGGDYEFPSVF